MCKNSNLTVLMSLYYKETASNLVECFNSLLAQTIQATEWVVVEDGPLNDGLYEVLEEYQNKYPNLIKRVKLEKNVGLGLALREGVLNCSNEMIARMDTDDICVPERFEKELEMFENNPDLDVCGTYIKEFDGDINNIISERAVPIKHDDIVKYQKRRSALNHMTVMYKKSSVLKSGNYEHAPLMEDDLLWTRMILSGCKMTNIPEYLVYARTGLNMIGRRGGFSYLKKYKKSRRKVYDLGFISYWDYLVTLFFQFFVALAPAKLRIFIFIKFLRK